jgi:hypothetical protein
LSSSSIRAYFKVNSGLRSSFVYRLQHSLSVIPIFIARRRDVEMAVDHDLQMVVFVVSPVGSEWPCSVGTRDDKVWLGTLPYPCELKSWVSRKKEGAHLDPSVINLGSFCISILMLCRNW